MHVDNYIHLSEEELLNEMEELLLQYNILKKIYEKKTITGYKVVRYNGGFHKNPWSVYGVFTTESVEEFDEYCETMFDFKEKKLHTANIFHRNSEGEWIHQYSTQLY